MDEDARLMEQVKNGDTAAFDLLMNRYKKPVLNFIYRMVPDVATAEELAQDVFVRIYMARARYRPRARFSTWLFKIATNTTLKYIRKNRRLIRQSEMDRPGDEGTGRFYKLSVDPGDSALEKVERKEMTEMIRVALRELPEKERMALSLRKYEEFSYKEIAAIMKCSVGAIKTYIHRGKLRLRDVIRNMERPLEPAPATKKVVPS
jgi:RNA polymerase sigma-70 factor (ECF subfamily)